MIQVTMSQVGVRKLCKKWERQCGSGNYFSQKRETVGFNATMLCVCVWGGGGGMGFRLYVRSGTEWDSGNYVTSGRKWDSANYVTSGILLAVSEVGFSYVTSGRDSGIQVTISEVGATV